MTAQTIKANTEAFERDILIAESGFRECDARWLFPEQLNLRGAQVLGMAIGTLLYELGAGVKGRYIADLAKDGRLNRRLKAVVACGNGTAGAYAPQALRDIGVDVIEMDCELDYTFPRYNPNPEDLHMLHALGGKVRE